MQVSRLKLFNPNVTAEKVTAGIFDAPATDSKFLKAQSAGPLEKFAESIRHYQQDLRLSFEELASAAAEPARKADRLRSSIQGLDDSACGIFSDPYRACGPARGRGIDSCFIRRFRHPEQFVKLPLRRSAPLPQPAPMPLRNRGRTCRPARRCAGNVDTRVADCGGTGDRS
jgi:hypothetical protein